jgi:1-acyl-sn-glycerol-3-phosphate acyltransferase
VQIKKCDLVFSAKMGVGRRWAAAEAPSLGRFGDDELKVRRGIRIFFTTLSMYFITHLIVFVVLIIGLFTIPFLNKLHINSMKKNVSILLLRIVGVKSQIIGMENIDLGKKYIVVANHPSFYDIIILMTVLPGSQMIAQAFIKRIPVFGYILGKVGAFFVDPKKIMETKSSLDGSMRIQESIIIFPEGGRSEKGEIKHFHRGFVYLLRKSSFELLPITLNGLFSLKPAKRWYIDPYAVIEIIIHKPLSQNAIEKQTDNELIKTAEDIITAEYKM